MGNNMKYVRFMDLPNKVKLTYEYLECCNTPHPYPSTSDIALEQLINCTITNDIPDIGWACAFTEQNYTWLILKWT